MIASLAQPPRGAGRSLPNHTARLVGLFWVFSYAVLSIRGAIYADDWLAFFSGERALAVTAGAGAYWLVLKQLDAGARVTLRAAVVWIAVATLAIMLIRLVIDDIFVDAPDPLGANVRWSLAWSGYFGLWVMGAIAFRRDWARACKVAVQQPAAAAVIPAAIVRPQAANLDNLELVLAAIVAEAATLRAADRAELADRVLKLGGYELAGDRDEYAAIHNERVRFALRLSARIAGTIR